MPLGVRRGHLEPSRRAATGPIAGTARGGRRQSKSEEALLTAGHGQGNEAHARAPSIPIRARPGVRALRGVGWPGWQEERA
jgi:hypothetical protein